MKRIQRRSGRPAACQSNMSKFYCRCCGNDNINLFNISRWKQVEEKDESKSHLVIICIKCGVFHFVDFMGNKGKEVRKKR